MGEGKWLCLPGSSIVGVWSSMLGGGVDQRIPYSYSLHFSDKFSCINYFNPGYGLKDINLIS